MDRSWMQLRNRRSPQYIDGVREFILFARDHMKPETDKIWCPCYRCNNHIQKTIEEVEIHLYAYGVVTSYTRWVYHGEGFELNDNDDSQNENDEYLDNVIEKSNSPNTEVREVIHDIRSGTTTFGYVGEASSSRNPDLPSSCGGETNKFARLMRDAEQDLYPDCQRFSKLSFMVKLLHLKIFNRWSNKSLTMLLELLKEALPIGETLPCSYNEAKQIIRDLGLDYQKIHVCKNDCVLFWKEYENEDECPTCKAPRYKVRKGKGKGRKIPHKVLRYFPLKPRLQRLFISRKTAIDMKWHKDKRVEEENVLRHPADSEAWKDFDKKHESFAKDPRNVRLGLASDGFNPFGNMSNSYSIWPVFLVPYNLPPWKCLSTVPASIELVDIAGLVKGASQGEGLGNKFLSHIREVDSILQSMSTRGRGRAGYVPRPHAPTPHASTKSVRSSTQSTPGPHASIKSVRSSTLHPFTSESVHEVTSQVSHSDTSSTHCNTDVGTSKGKRGRGKSRSLKLAKLKNQGVRLPIQICKVSGRPYGEASEKFTSELGIVTRQFAPQNVPSWTDISEEDKETLVAYLQEGFKFTNEPYAIESILNLMHDRYKSYRHDLRQRFRSFPTMESALADPPENMEKETWKFLCEKWSDKDYKVRCGKNKLNREKLKVLHTAGSKAFRKVQYDERDRGTGEELGLVELYKKTHFSEKKEAWVHADAEIRHYKLEKRQEKAIEEGSCPISDEQLSIEVFGQKVGYIRGLGRGRKPSTTLSGKLTRAQLERDNEAATREAEEQRRINEELVGRIQILESDRTEYNAKVDFLMQQISRRVPSTDSSS
ncbi:unnamed protein product [Camellia sinensis]